MPPLEPDAPRLCLVAPEFVGPYRNGGVGTACYWQALLLRRSGYDVTVLYTGPTSVHNPDHWEHFFPREHGLNYVDLNHWAATHCPEENESARLPDIHELAQANKTLRFLLAHPFPLVLLQEFLGHGVRALQYRAAGLGLHGTRFVLTAHGPIRWTYEGMRQLFHGRQQVCIDAMERTSARLCPEVVAPSAHMAGWMQRNWNLPPEKTTVAPYAFEEAPERRGRHTHHGLRNLIFFGRLETRKGLHFFLRALRDSPRLQQQVGRVTFLGKPERVLGVPAMEAIREALDPAWRDRWEVLPGMDSNEVWEYLSSREDALVVAPSLLDNLPYAVIELYRRGKPLLTTRTGGIPEIVGERNAGLLCEPSTNGLRQRMEAIFRDGMLTVDYDSGYATSRANQTQLDVLKRKIPPPPVDRVQNPAFTFCQPPNRFRPVLPQGWRREQCDWPDALAASDGTADEVWVIADADDSLDADALACMAAALVSSGADAMIPFRWETREGQRTRLRAPATSDLEQAFFDTELQITPIAVRRATLEAIRKNGGQQEPALLATALRAQGYTVELFPEAIAEGPECKRSPSAQLRTRCTAATPSEGAAETFACNPVLQGLYARTRPNAYQLYAGLADALNACDGELAQARQRLQQRLPAWQQQRTRVMIYGIGEHTRALLMLCPWLGEFVTGFIDQRGGQSFAGRPCIAPDAFTHEVADAVIYSSRASEGDMYKRLANSPVEHVLLYN